MSLVNEGTEHVFTKKRVSLNSFVVFAVQNQAMKVLLLQGL